MSPEWEEKIKKNFSEAKIFAIAREKDCSEEIFLAAEALSETLKNSGFAVYQFPIRENQFVKKWSAVLPLNDNNPLLFSTSILIPKNRFGAKEISYSDDGQNISINIGSDKEEIIRENVIFKTVPIKTEAVFYFGENKKDEIEKMLADIVPKNILLPNEEKILLINAEPTATFSEQVFKIIKANNLTAGHESNVPNLLLASFLSETGGLISGLTVQTTDFFGDILRLGADKSLIEKIISQKEDSFIQLFGRAMARLSRSESPCGIWSFLSLQDLEKTKNENADYEIFCDIAEKIKNFFFLPDKDYFPFILLWQRKNGVSGIIFVDKDDTAEKLKTAIPAEIKNGFLRLGIYKNFTEAELKIKTALKEAV